MNKTAKGFAVLLAVFLIVALSSAAQNVIQVQPDIRPISPNDTVQIALADAKTLPEAIRYNTRYLSLHNYSPQERIEVVQVIDFVINSLSKERAISHVQPVGGSNNSIVRVNLELYAISPEGWDRLAEKGSGPSRVDGRSDQPEPYYQLRATSPSIAKKQKVKVPVTPYRADDGQMYDFKYEEREVQAEVVVTGPWLDPTAILGLSTATKSGHPILRADWFIANATITPAYNEILGFKTLKDFQDFTLYDQRALRDSIKGVVVDSKEVALHQRAVKSTPGARGWYHETFDFKTSLDQNDLLRNLLNEKSDAGEAFGHGPNKMQFFVIYDGQQKLLDFGDPAIVVDMTTQWKDKRVWGGMISCTTCHSDGAKDVEDEVRLLSKPSFALGADARLSKEELRQLRDLFFTDPITEPIAATRQQYVSRLQLASRGLAPKKASSALGKLFLRYVDGGIGLDEAAAECGTTVANLKALLPHLKATDPRLVQLDAGRRIRRDQWETYGYPELAKLIYAQGKVKP